MLVRHIQRVLSQLLMSGLCVLAFVACSRSSVESRTEEPLDNASAILSAISSDPVMLRVFLREFPKGGDLHNHSDGTPFAEQFINWSSKRGFCVSRTDQRLVHPPCDSDALVEVQDLKHTEPALYADIVDAMSVRSYLVSGEVDASGHEQFFDSFGKFIPITSEESPRVIATVRKLASEDRALYVELMDNPDVFSAYIDRVNDVEWDSEDLEGAFERFYPEIEILVSRASAERDRHAASIHQILQCDKQADAAGCEVEIRYLGYGLRHLPGDQLFRQLALAFALADSDERVVGVNLVQPEDDPRSVENYQLHMRMFAFLSEQYPEVGVTLHAGELTHGLAPAYALRRHIRDAIEIAGAQRIGHGIDIAFELNARETLERMAKERIAVEINLSSNDVILGVSGADHPLNLYRASGVPFVLSTDDMGVLRTDLTEQYVRAVLEHGLTYDDLKTASRNSLQFSFLPGEGIWEDDSYQNRNVFCVDLDSIGCEQLLQEDAKGRLQRDLERRFDTFEADIKNWAHVIEDAQTARAQSD